MARAAQEKVYTIKALLGALDSFKASNDPAVTGEATVVSEVVFTYKMPNGGESMTVTRENLDGQAGDNWPWVGTYYVDIVDAEGESILPGGKPWCAKHYDADALKSQERKEPSADIFEEYRILNRTIRAQLTETERREAKARGELNEKIDVIGKLQTEKNNAVLERDRANAAAEFAEAKRKEAEEALEELEDSIAKMQPHIAALVDRGFGKVVEMFGGPPALGNGNAPENDAPPASEKHPTVDPDDLKSCVNDVLRSVVFDEALCLQLVHDGILKWEVVRSLYKFQFKRDIGEEPGPEFWAEWEAQQNAPDGDEAPKEGAA